MIVSDQVVLWWRSHCWWHGVRPGWSLWHCPNITATAVWSCAVSAMPMIQVLWFARKFFKVSWCEERPAPGSCWRGRFGSWCLRSCRLVFVNATLGVLWACSDCALSWWIPSCGKWCFSPVKCCMTQQPCRYCDRCGTDVGPTAAYCHGHGGVVLGACCEVADGWYDVPSLEGDFMLVYVVTTLYSLRLRDALQWFLCVKSFWFDDSEASDVLQYPGNELCESRGFTIRHIMGG